MTTDFDVRVNTKPSHDLWETLDTTEGPYLVLFKEGGSVRVQELSGGGMDVLPMPEGGADAAYEVHGTLLDGCPVTISQACIAAVLHEETMQQVEFGNPFVATHAGHPRGQCG